MLFRALACGAAAALSSSRPIETYKASDPAYFTWAGRFLVNKTGAVALDVEGTSVKFTVANATYVGVVLDDASYGGARLGVYMDTNVSVAGVGDPNPAGRAMPNLRVATLLTSTQQALYTLGSGGQINALAITYTLQLLTEWELINGPQGHLLSVVSFVTDGVFGPPPPAPQRRLVILGDSLSSGPGAGFNVPPSGAPCGSGVPVNDVSGTWGSRLCANFSAACEIVAGSGITLMADAAYNLPLVFPWALGSMVAWPPAARVRWSFPAADAVLIELGENDCHAWPCTGNASTLRALAGGFVAFVQAVAEAYGGDKALPVFLTIADHEAGQSAAMALALPQLAALGYSRVAFLNATAPDAVNGTSIDNGCAGHPSAAQNELAFERARPVVAAALGW